MEEGGDVRNSRRSDGEIGHHDDVQDKICCLCGDIGFSDDLLRCLGCGYRLQHTYCSRLYPDKLDKDNWVCEWCIHHQHQHQHQHQREQEDEAQRKRIKPTTSTTPAGGVGGGGTYSSGAIRSPVVVVGPKKNSKAVDRWRRLARAAKMGSGRRYKLLADVLCP